MYPSIDAYDNRFIYFSCLTLASPKDRNLSALNTTRSLEDDMIWFISVNFLAIFCDTTFIQQTRHRMKRRLACKQSNNRSSIVSKTKRSKKQLRHKIMKSLPWDVSSITKGYLRLDQTIIFIHLRSVWEMLEILIVWMKPNCTELYD